MNERQRHQRTFRQLFWDSILGWVVARVWGLNLKPGDGEEDGLGETISLLGILLVWQAALLAYVHGKPNPEFRVFIVYVIVSLLPLIGMFSVCSMDKINDAHRRIGWRLSMLAAILVVSLGFSYYERWLPGQFETGIYPDANTKYRGVPVEREIVGVINTRWNAELTDRAAQYWRVQQVKCFEDEARTKEINTFKGDSKKSTATSIAGTFPSPSRSKYYFLVQLEQIAPEPKDFGFSKEDVVLDIIPVTE